MELLKKLRVKEEVPVHVINAPAECLSLFEGLRVKTSLPGKIPASQLILFAESSQVLNSYIYKLKGKLAEDVLFWVAYPQQSGSIQSDLIRNKGWEEMFKLYDGVSSVSINDDWTGMRFKHRRKSNTGWVPMEERKKEGIDYVARTVVLPADALKAMKPYKGLDDFFYTLAFTHKKEYVESIVDAKKPETRQRRIEKMLEMVLKLKTEKEIKQKKAKS